MLKTPKYLSIIAYVTVAPLSLMNFTRLPCMGEYYVLLLLGELGGVFISSEQGGGTYAQIFVILSTCSSPKNRTLRLLSVIFSSLGMSSSESESKFCFCDEFTSCVNLNAALVVTF